MKYFYEAIPGMMSSGTRIPEKEDVKPEVYQIGAFPAYAGMNRER